MDCRDYFEIASSIDALKHLLITIDNLNFWLCDCECFSNSAGSSYFGILIEGKKKARNF